MELIKLVSEQEASDDVKQVYSDIKQRYQIDFVPNLFQSMAHNPKGLVNNWERIKHHEDVLGMEMAHAVGLSIAAQSPCNYCMFFHGMILKQLGWSDEKIENLISWAAQSAGGSIYANGLQLRIDQPASQMLEKAV